MTTVSITSLKTNPASAIADAQDFPVAVQNRNDTEAYLIGKNLFEKMIVYLEDLEDKKTIENINLSDKVDFEEFVDTLSI